MQLISSVELKFDLQSDVVENENSIFNARLRSFLPYRDLQVGGSWKQEC